MNTAKEKALMITIYSCFIIFVLYCLSALVTWSYNPGAWWWGVRLADAIIWVGLMVIGLRTLEGDDETGEK